MFKADFTVVTIAREPLPVLRRFIDWHLGQGAERIILYFDDPDDPAIDALKGEPRLDPRPCTTTLWTSLGVDPEARFTRRQRAAMTAAYREAETDWVLILDADERMWFRDGSIRDLLAWQSEDTLSLRVRSAETVWLDDGAQALRLPLPRRAVNEVYGEDADLFRKREGLIGHCEGKAFHRSGLDRVNIKLHWAEDLDGNPLRGPVLGPQDRAHLVHDIAPDYDAWRAKMEWRAGAHGFSGPLKERVAEIAATDDPERGYRALYRRLHRLDPDAAIALAAAGGLLREMPGTGKT
jgi:PAS domain-containing protein